MIAIDAQGVVGPTGELTVRVTPDRPLPPGAYRVRVVVEVADEAAGGPDPDGYPPNYYTPEERELVNGLAPSEEVLRRAVEKSRPWDELPDEPLDLLGPPSKELLEYASRTGQVVPGSSRLGVDSGPPRPQSEDTAGRDPDRSPGDCGGGVAGGGRDLDVAGRAAP